MGSMIVALLAWGAAQQPFTQGTELVVMIEALNVREAPGLNAARVGQLTHGARGSVLDASPHWADGYWWWRVAFRGTQGWIADGDDALIYVADAWSRSAIESFRPFENTGAWTQAHFAAALELGLTFHCRGDDRRFSASSFMGAPYPASPCPEDARYRHHKFDAAEAWQWEQPVAHLLGSHVAGDTRVYFVSYLENALRGTGNFTELLIYTQRPNRIPEFAFTISAQGNTYDSSRPDSVRLSTKLFLPQEPNCCPSFLIHQEFRADEAGLVLANRETVLNDYGELARRMREQGDASTSTPAPSPETVTTIINEVAAIALDQRLTSAERERQMMRLQNSWEAELLTMAVRIMPVYDPGSGSWRSFDSWARDEAAATGIDAPFTRDPVGSTVRMVFDPSVRNVAEQLGLPNPFGW